MTTLEDIKGLLKSDFVFKSSEEANIAQTEMDILAATWGYVTVADVLDLSNSNHNSDIYNSWRWSNGAIANGTVEFSEGSWTIKLPDPFYKRP